MFRSTIRYALTGSALLAGVSLPLWAYQAVNEPPRTAPQDNVPDSLKKAREMVSLISQGQLDLEKATQLAEKHVMGTALEATCAIRPPEPLGGGAKDPAAPSMQDKPPKDEPVGSSPANQRRLIYAVSCFVKDKLQVVHVDGLSKKVLMVQDEKDTSVKTDKP